MSFVDMMCILVYHSFRILLKSFTFVRRESPDEKKRTTTYSRVVTDRAKQNNNNNKKIEKEKKKGSEWKKGRGVVCIDQSKKTRVDTTTMLV